MEGNASFLAAAFLLTAVVLLLYVQQLQGRLKGARRELEALRERVLETRTPESEGRP